MIGKAKAGQVLLRRDFRDDYRRRRLMPARPATIPRLRRRAITGIGAPAQCKHGTSPFRKQYRAHGNYDMRDSAFFLRTPTNYRRAIARHADAHSALSTYIYPALSALHASRTSLN